MTYYNIQLAYTDQESGVGSVKYVKQILNERLEFIEDIDFEIIIKFPIDLIPGSEMLFINGKFVSPLNYNLETGHINELVEDPDTIYCTYSVLLDQEPGQADHLDMPALSVIDLGQDEPEPEPELEREIYP